MSNAYILLLEGGKYYIGRTDDVLKKFREHIKGTVHWTRKYKPIMIESVLYNISPFQHDNLIKEYMAKYGIDNVRGGSYVTEILDNIQVRTLTRELKLACQACGVKGHYMKNCPLVTPKSISCKQEYITTFNCNKCQSILYSQKQLDFHLVACTGRASIMRISENNSEFLPKREVLWVIKQYIMKMIYENKNTADIPLGPQYTHYIDYIKTYLKYLYPEMSFEILKSNLQIRITF